MTSLQRFFAVYLKRRKPHGRTYLYPMANIIYINIFHKVIRNILSFYSQLLRTGEVDTSDIIPPILHARLIIRVSNNVARKYIVIRLLARGRRLRRFISRVYLVSDGVPKRRCAAFGRLPSERIQRGPIATPMPPLPRVRRRVFNTHARRIQCD